MNSFYTVAAADSFPRGEGRTVEARGRRFAVYNLDGEFYALDDVCPHRGGPLGAGTLEHGQIYCPLHGWAFKLETGACVNHPNRPVRTYPVRVENGEIQIQLL